MSYLEQSPDELRAGTAPVVFVVRPSPSVPWAGAGLVMQFIITIFLFSSGIGALLDNGVYSGVANLQNNPYRYEGAIRSAIRLEIFLW